MSSVLTSRIVMVAFLIGMATSADPQGPAGHDADRLRTLASAKTPAALLEAMVRGVGRDYRRARGTTGSTAVRGGDPWIELGMFSPSDAKTGDFFGIDVDVSGDTALVGAPTATGSAPGAAYVYVREEGTWVEQAKLVAPDGEAGDGFAIAVAIDGDTALVTAPGDREDGVRHGSTYVFVRNGDSWIEQAKLIASDPTEATLFGRSVALDGDTAIIGSTFASSDELFTGAAYVFTRVNETWGERIKLVPADAQQDSRVGYAVALAGETALVTAPLAMVEGNPFQGAAYIFTGSGASWTEQAKLTASDGEMEQLFGTAAALTGDTALVSAATTKPNGHPGPGAAYVFAGSGASWSEQAKLTASDGGPDDAFGFDLALTDDLALVGSPNAVVEGKPQQGAAYIFTRVGESWSEHAKLTASDGAAGDKFGWAVGPSDSALLVGAPESDAENLDAGAVYVFVPNVSMAPLPLVVDPQPLSSDGNGVFEPGELAVVAPAWRNDGTVAHNLQGTASALTGPVGPVYELEAGVADYGLAEPEVPVSCLEVGVCYQMQIGTPGGERPVLDWDATFEEALSDPLATTRTWELHLGDSFGDVARTNTFYLPVEALLHHGVSVGCGGGEFCPGASLSRAVMAPLLLRAQEGGGFVPLPCVEDEEVFADVPADDPFCPWIEELFERGVVLGCDGDNYCPTQQLTRAQAPVYLLRALEGAEYTPPACVEGEQVFADVPVDHPFCSWIQELFARGITAGCGSDNYCPAQATTRAAVAAFLFRTFDLGLYDP